MRVSLALALLSIAFGCAFTCNGQPQSPASPSEESLRNQCNDLLAARGYVATGQAGVWTKTVSGIIQTWKLSKITIQPPIKTNDPYYGFILLDKYESGDTSPHGSFAEGFTWQDESHIWVPLLPNVVVSH
jgi:hypothetical protein